MKRILMLIALLVLTAVSAFAFSPATSVKNLCHQIDINNDGFVNHPDLGILLSQWHNECSENNNWCNRADITQDGIVDWRDLRLLIRFYGKEC